MRPSPAPISTHRLARLIAWARLWLVWCAGLFAACWKSGAPMHKRTLDKVARVVARLIVISAAARIAPPTQIHRHGRRKRATLRIAAGSRLRAALRGDDAPSRLFAILNVMRDIERHIAQLVRRLRHGATRLRVLLPARASEALTHAAAPTLSACADTS